MEIIVKKQVTVEETLDVDSRLYLYHSKVWNVADLILDGRLDNLASDLYHEDSSAVRRAVDVINEAFKKADKVMDYLEVRE